MKKNKAGAMPAIAPAIPVAPVAPERLSLGERTARMGGLVRIQTPTLGEAREFFNWSVQRAPIFRADGSEIAENSEFQRVGADGTPTTLYVGLSTYSPFQPGASFEKIVSALDAEKLDYGIHSVGELDGGKEIFAQFCVDAASEFAVNGKPHSGYLTMAKGQDRTTELMVFLTVICPYCRNSFRLMVRAGNREIRAGRGVRRRQSKHSTLVGLEGEIRAWLQAMESVKSIMEKMTQTPLNQDDARRAFAALIAEPETNRAERGQTRLANRLDEYMAAFRSDAAGTEGKTREDWLQSVTYVDTHGNPASKTFDAGKQFISSEFGARAARKTAAFELSSNDEAFSGALETGEEILAGLLARPHAVTTTPAVGAAEFARLMGV